MKPDEYTELDSSYREIISQIDGIRDAYKKNELICECHSVGTREVCDYLGPEKDTDLSELAKKTRASTGCGSCKCLLDKWAGYWTQFREEIIEIRKQNFRE